MNDLLSSQLHADLQDAVPDLDRLAAGAIASGRRRRHVRRAGIALVGLGAVAGISALGVVVAGGDDAPTEVRDNGWAASSSEAPALQVGQTLDLGNGLTGTVADDKTGFYELGASTLDGAGTGFVVVISGSPDWWGAAFDRLTSDYPGVTVVVSVADAEAVGLIGTLDEAPVTAPDGWTCEWFLEDDKASCEAADGGFASLVIRDAAGRAAWVGDPDKGDDPAVFTTGAHDGIFISVQGGRGVTNAEIQELGEGLEWVD